MTASVASATTGVTTATDTTLAATKPIGASASNTLKFYTGVAVPTTSIVRVPILDITGTMCIVSGTAITSANYIEIDEVTLF